MTTKPILRVAIYARVSSDRQAAEGTIASQLEALRQRLNDDGRPLEEELCFCDDGGSGSTLLRPALERLRDQVANGGVDRLYVYSPDRLARKYAYQVLLLDEFQRAGVEIVFRNRPVGQSAEDELLLQVQGVIAEYERAKIRERGRRGKLHGARQGRVAVLSGAPYGYRYVSKQEGGGLARYEIVFEQARVVRQIFAWVSGEGLSLGEVSRRLQKQGVPSPTGKPRWSAATLAYLLKNPAYQGLAGYGKSRVIPRQPQLRPRRGQPAVPRRPYSVTRVDTAPIALAVPALISAEEFAVVTEQLASNRSRHRQQRAGARYLLQGLVVCRQCGYALHGLTRARKGSPPGAGGYVYYRCGGRQALGGDASVKCTLRQVRSADLEEKVWQDVCQLLQHPQKIEEEYQRRLARPGAPTRGLEPLERVIEKVKRTLARLIDAYSDGLLDKTEFEPRVRGARERLEKLEAEAQTRAAEEAQQAELRLALTHLQDFADQVGSGLEKADWATRREIIRAVVKRIEVAGNEVRIVYRIAPVPFVDGPRGGLLQDCQKCCS